MLGAVRGWWRRWMTRRDQSAHSSMLISVGRSVGDVVVRRDGQDIAGRDVAPVVSVDEGLLSRCRTQWQFGDWATLASLRLEDVQHHPERAKLAALVAAGHHQLGDSGSAKAWVALARTWGCDRRLVARLLVGGVYNTLAKVASASGQHARALAHFQQAVQGTDGDERLLVQVRSVREVAQMGLLNDAADRIKSQLTTLKDAGSLRSLSMNDPRLYVVNTQIELIQHEIQLVQKRGAAAHRADRLQASAAPRDGLAMQPDSTGSLDLASLRARSTSQLGQDLWVLERTGYKRNGFFVEFGATDGVRLSNTYLLETAFGWQGICAEPNPVMFARLSANRRCQVTTACVGPTTGETVDFVFADEYGGMARDMAGDMHANRRAAFATMPQFRAELETVSLNDLLVSMNAPRDIDYVSIDTEGSELSILQSFPFEKWTVRCWTVEHNHVKAAREGVFDLLVSHGYDRVEASWDDWYYLKE